MADISPAAVPPEINILARVISAAPKSPAIEHEARLAVASILDGIRDRFHRTPEATKAAAVAQRFRDAEASLTAAEAALANCELLWRTAVENGKSSDNAETNLLAARQQCQLAKDRVELLRPLAADVAGEQTRSWQSFRKTELRQAKIDAETKLNKDAIALWPQLEKLLRSQLLQALVHGSLDELRLTPTALTASGPPLVPVKESVA